MLVEQSEVGMGNSGEVRLVGHYPRRSNSSGRGLLSTARSGLSGRACTGVKRIEAHLATANVPGAQDTWAVLLSQSTSLQTFVLYGQRYDGLFRVVDGKTVLFQKYFNPIVFVEAFALNEGGEFGNQ